MRIKTKLGLSLGSLSLLILGVGVFAVISLSRLETQNDIYTSLITSDIYLNKSRLSQADYMITKDPNFAQELKHNVQLAIRELDSLRTIMSVQSSIDEIIKIESAVQNFSKVFDALKSVLENTETDQGRQAAVDRVFSSAKAASD